MSDLPDGWIEKSLGELAIISSSKRIFHSEYQKKGIPFYRSKEIIEKQKGGYISTELFITNEKFNDIKAKFGAPIKNDLLLTSVGTLGVPYLVKANEIFYFKDGNLTWFRGYKNLYPQFLYFFFLSAIGKERLNEITIGSTQRALTISGLRTIPIKIPSIEEQKAIANILTAFDKKIALLQAQNQTLETLAQTIFKEWFVDFNYPDATGEMVDSELGKIPQGWKAGNLLNIVKLTGGGTPKTSIREYWDGDIPWFSVVDAPKENSCFVINTEKKISTMGLNNSSTKLLRQGTTIVSARGTVGKLALVGQEMAMNQSCYGINAKDGFGNYYVFFQMKKMIEHIKKNVHGAVFDTITKATFEHIAVSIAPKRLVENFENLASPVMHKVLNNVYQIQSLTKTRNTLLPKLMSGKKRVSYE